MSTDTYEERVAICVESGVALERAQAIARCEQLGGRCICGAHPRRAA